jgi:tRNA A-37 threonylcarbamoyl transferase component Bud32
MSREEEIDSLVRGVAAAPPLAPRAPARSLVGTKIGNYQITRVIGEGGMGVVYLGEHPRIGKQVAIKVLHKELAENPEIVSRFFTEARAVNDIHHEHIVDILDFGEARSSSGRERVYLLMELLLGENLHDRLARGVPGHEEVVHILSQAADALAASHSKGIIHRDLKPENIFLARRNDDACFVKLLDFGIAKLSKDESAWKTQTGALIGTPLYMSPEQCAGRKEIDPRADIYSLGVVLYELLTGRVPFRGNTLTEILRGHLTEAPVRPSAIAPDVPPALETIALKCLAKNPNQRFSSTEELGAALQSAVAPQRTILMSSVGEMDGLAKTSAPLWAVAIGAVVVAGVLALVVFRPAKQPERLPPVAVSEPEKKIVHIVVDSQPRGALVRRVGATEPLGKTPMRLEIIDGEDPFRVQLSLDGWKSEERMISSETDQVIRVPLEKAVVAPPPPKRKSPPKRAPQEPAAPATKDPLDDKLL